MGDGHQEGGIVIEQGLSVEMLPGASKRMTPLPYPKKERQGHRIWIASGEKEAGSGLVGEAVGSATLEEKGRSIVWHLERTLGMKQRCLKRVFCVKYTLPS